MIDVSLPVAHVYTITPDMVAEELDLLLWQAMPPLFRIPNPQRPDSLSSRIIHIRNAGTTPAVLTVFPQRNRTRPPFVRIIESGSEMPLSFPDDFNDQNGHLLVSVEGGDPWFFVLAPS